MLWRSFSWCLKVVEKRARGKIRKIPDLFRMLSIKKTALDKFELFLLEKV